MELEKALSSVNEAKTQLHDLEHRLQRAASNENGVLHPTSEVRVVAGHSPPMRDIRKVSRLDSRYQEQPKTHRAVFSSESLESRRYVESSPAPRQHRIITPTAQLSTADWDKTSTMDLRDTRIRYLNDESRNMNSNYPTDPEIDISDDSEDIPEWKKEENFRLALRDLKNDKSDESFKKLNEVIRRQQERHAAKMQMTSDAPVHVPHSEYDQVLNRTFDVEKEEAKLPVRKIARSKAVPSYQGFSVPSDVNAKRRPYRKTLPTNNNSNKENAHKTGATSKQRITRKIAAPVPPEKREQITPASWRIGHERVMEHLGRAVPKKPKSKKPQDSINQNDKKPETDAPEVAWEPTSSDQKKQDQETAKEDEGIVMDGVIIKDKQQLALLDELKIETEVTQPAKRRPLKRKSKKEFEEPKPPPPVRHYKSEEIQKYMEKQKKDRMLKMKSERSAARRKKEERDRRLKFLADKQKQACSSRPPKKQKVSTKPEQPLERSPLLPRHTPFSAQPVFETESDGSSLPIGSMEPEENHERSDYDDARSQRSSIMDVDALIAKYSQPVEDLLSQIETGPLEKDFPSTPLASSTFANRVSDKEKRIQALYESSLQLQEKMRSFQHQPRPRLMNLQQSTPRQETASSVPSYDFDINRYITPDTFSAQPGKPLAISSNAMPTSVTTSDEQEIQDEDSDSLSSGPLSPASSSSTLTEIEEAPLNDVIADFPKPERSAPIGGEPENGLDKWSFSAFSDSSDSERIMDIVERKLAALREQNARKETEVQVDLLPEPTRKDSIESLGERIVSASHDRSVLSNLAPQIGDENSLVLETGPLDYEAEAGESEHKSENSRVKHLSSLSPPDRSDEKGDEGEVTTTDSYSFDSADELSKLGKRKLSVTPRMDNNSADSSQSEPEHVPRSDPLKNVSKISASQAERFSPDVLEMQMQAELNYYSGLADSIQHISEMERIRAIGLARQDTATITDLLLARQHEHQNEPTRKEKVEPSSERAELREIGKTVIQSASKSAEAIEKIREEMARNMQMTTERFLEYQAQIAHLAESQLRNQAPQPGSDAKVPTPLIEGKELIAETTAAAVHAALNVLKDQKPPHVHDRSVQMTRVNDPESANPYNYSTGFDETGSDLTQTLPRDSNSPPGSDLAATKPSSLPTDDQVVSNAASEAASVEQSSGIKTASYPPPAITTTLSRHSPQASSVQESEKVTSDHIERQVTPTGSISTRSETSHSTADLKSFGLSDAPLPVASRSIASPDPSDLIQQHSLDESLSEEDRSFRELLPSESHRKQAQAPLMGADDSFAKFTLSMVQQHMREENLRAQHQASLLKLREKALREKAKTELAWLDQQKKLCRDKGADDKYPQIRKRQRGLLIKLQQEQAEIQRLKEQNRVANRERQFLLYQQQEISRLRQTTLHLKEKLKDAKSPTSVELKISELTDEEDSKLEEGELSEDSTGAIFALPKSDDDNAAAAAPAMDTKIAHLFKKFNQDAKYLTSREQKLRQRRKKAEELLAWRKRLDQQEQEVFKLETEALSAWKTDKKSPQKFQPKMESSASQATMTEETSPSTEPVYTSPSANSKQSVPEESASPSTSSKDVSKGSITEQITSYESPPKESVAASVSVQTADSVTPEVVSSTPVSVDARAQSSAIPPETVASPLSPTNLSMLRHRRAESYSETEESVSHTETASDQSDAEGRIRALNDELWRRKGQVERLKHDHKKQRRDRLKVQEESLRKQIEAYDAYIEKLKVDLAHEMELEPGQRNSVKPKIKQPPASTDAKKPVCKPNGDFEALPSPRVDSPKRRYRDDDGKMSPDLSVRSSPSRSFRARRSLQKQLNQSPSTSLENSIHSNVEVTSSVPEVATSGSRFEIAETEPSSIKSEPMGSVSPHSIIDEAGFSEPSPVPSAEHVTDKYSEDFVVSEAADQADKTLTSISPRDINIPVQKEEPVCNEADQLDDEAVTENDISEKISLDEDVADKAKATTPPLSPRKVESGMSEASDLLSTTTDSELDRVIQNAAAAVEQFTQPDAALAGDTATERTEEQLSVDVSHRSVAVDQITDSLMARLLSDSLVLPKNFLANLPGDSMSAQEDDERPPPRRNILDLVLEDSDDVGVQLSPKHAVANKDTQVEQIASSLTDSLLDESLVTMVAIAESKMDTSPTHSPRSAMPLESISPRKQVLLAHPESWPRIAQHKDETPPPPSRTPISPIIASSLPKSIQGDISDDLAHLDLLDDSGDHYFDDDFGFNKAVDASIAQVPDSLIVPHTPDDIQDLAERAVNLFWQQRRFGERLDQVVPDATYFSSSSPSYDLGSQARYSFERMVFGLCSEFVQDIYDEEQEDMDQSVSEHLGRKKLLRPNRLLYDGFPTSKHQLTKLVEAHVQKHISLQTVLFDAAHKPALNCLRKNWNRVEEMLVGDLNTEERDWVDYTSDEGQVKEQKVDAILDDLVDETVEHYLNILRRRLA